MNEEQWQTDTLAKVRRVQVIGISLIGLILVTALIIE